MRFGTTEGKGKAGWQLCIGAELLPSSVDAAEGTREARRQAPHRGRAAAFIVFGRRWCRRTESTAARGDARRRCRREEGCGPASSTSEPSCRLRRVRPNPLALDGKLGSPEKIHRSLRNKSPYFGSPLQSLSPLPSSLTSSSAPFIVCIPSYKYSRIESSRFLNSLNDCSYR